MHKSKFTDEKMVRITREADKAPVADIAKKHGVSDQTIYLWRRRSGTRGVDAGGDGWVARASDAARREGGQ